MSGTGEPFDPTFGDFEGDDSFDPTTTLDSDVAARQFWDKVHDLAEDRPRFDDLHPLEQLLFAAVMRRLIERWRREGLVR